MTTSNINNIKIVILRSKLMEVVSSLQVAIPGDSVSLPILKNIYMKASDGKILFVATNLEVVVNVVVAGKVLQEGDFTVPFGVFSNIVKNLSSERVTLERNEAKLMVVTDNYEAIVYGQESDDFPLISESPDVISIGSFQGNVLRDIISNVFVATQFSDIRPEISGVHIYTRDDQVFFVATDSFRLAERALPLSSRREKDVSFTIPFKTVQDVVRVLPDSEEQVEVLLGEHQVVFKSEGQKLISRLIDGSFPDYKQIIPKDFVNEVTVNRMEFANAVKLVSSLSGKANDVTIRVGEGKKFVEIFSSDSALGENLYKVPSRVHGSVFSITFNWRYLLDGLKIFEGDDVTLGVNNSDKPAIIKSQSESFLIYIVMPIKG